MGVFNYAVLDLQGRQKKGTLEADNPRHARQVLRDRGLIPLEVSAIAGGAEAKTPGKAAAENRSNLSVADLALFTRQLSTLIQSGLPVADALVAIAQQTENPKSKALFSSLRSSVQEGQSIANAMGQFGRAFPSMYRATVAAGEHTGRLDLVLSKLADYTESSHRSRQKIKLALIYPSALMGLAIIVVAGLLTFVVPDVVGVFANKGQQLPGMTRALLGASDFLVAYGIYLVAGIVASVFGGRALLRDPARLEAWDHRLLSIPLVGRLSVAANSARFAGTLSTLVSSGVPLVDGLDIAAAVLSNTYLKRVVGEAATQVREGSSLKAALERSARFPPMMIHMIAAGEASGDLEKMLARVAESQQLELDNRVATMLGLLEPAVLLFMGVAVLCIVVAILQPIFELNNLVK